MLKPIVNPNFCTHWSGPLLVIEDFLLNIDEFREALMAQGEFSHSQKNGAVVDVGPLHDWRQILPATEFPAEFNAAIAGLQTTDEPVQFYGTNRFYSDMRLDPKRQRASNFPHSDYTIGDGNLPVVFNLWLHDGGGGTGFYKYDDYYTSSAMPRELRYFAENNAPAPGPDAGAYDSYFKGDDAWELWKVAEMKKNRAFVYCGDFWHRVLIPKEEFTAPNARYSFVAFSRGRAPKFLEESGSFGYLRNAGN